MTSSKNKKPAVSEKKSNGTRNEKTASEKLSNSDENTLSMYFAELGRIPVMSKEEEETTARLAAMGSKVAKDKMIRSNLKFVISVAKKFRNSGLPLEDLISEGNLGLMNAVEHFDVDKGFRFITYAVWWIRQAILKAISEKGRMIRLPISKASAIQKIENAKDSEFGDDMRNVALALNMVPEKMTELIKINREVVSLEDSMSANNTTMTISDCVEDDSRESPESYAETTVLRDELNAIIGNLNDRAATVLRCRYGLGDNPPMTLAEIGNRYNLSRERVRQIEEKAVLALQGVSRVGTLQSFLAS